MPTLPPSSEPTPRPLRGAELSELYPQPKTYDQQVADQADRARRQLARRPKFFVLNLTMRLYALAAAAALLVTMVPAIIFFNIIAGVFGVALLMILLLGACKWQADEVSALCDRAGINAGGFLLLYFTAIGPMTALGLFAVNTQPSEIARLGGYVAIGVVLLGVVGGLVRKMRQ